IDVTTPSRPVPILILRMRLTISMDFSPGRMDGRRKRSSKRARRRCSCACLTLRAVMRGISGPASYSHTTRRVDAQKKQTGRRPS
ncbi:hypothetical protein LZ30DRAFT_555025, partial [Colletotrichum cereale]